jgi:hypothetical protein
MNRNGRLVIVIVVFFGALILAVPAYAYIDPGTGSMIVQAVIAAIAAVSVSIGIFRRRLISFFGRIFGRKSSGDNGGDEASR